MLKDCLLLTRTVGEETL